MEKNIMILFRPYMASKTGLITFPGRCPGLDYCAPMGLKFTHMGDFLRIPANLATRSGNVWPLFGAKRRGPLYLTMVVRMCQRLSFRDCGHFLPHCFSFQVDDVRVVNDSIENCIRQSLAS